MTPANRLHWFLSNDTVQRGRIPLDYNPEDDHNEIHGWFPSKEEFVGFTRQKQKNFKDILPGARLKAWTTQSRYIPPFYTGDLIALEAEVARLHQQIALRPHTPLASDKLAEIDNLTHQINDHPSYTDRFGPLHFIADGTRKRDIKDTTPITPDYTPGELNKIARGYRTRLRERVHTEIENLRPDEILTLRKNLIEIGTLRAIETISAIDDIITKVGIPLN